MQAGLKCDRVPQNAPAEMRRIPYSTLSGREKALFCNKMAGKYPCSRPPILMLPNSPVRCCGAAGRARWPPLCPKAAIPTARWLTSPAMPTRSPILLISRLALHTKNILGDGRVSLMLDERAAGDPLEGARIMLAGRAEEATGEAAKILRRRYLNAHPSAEAFVDFKDFSFFRIAPVGPASGRRLWPHHRPQARAVSDRDRRCRRVAGSRAGRGRAHERGSPRGDEPLCDQTAGRRSPPIGAAPAATPTAWTCRPAARRCGSISRSGSPAPSALRKMLVRLAGEARAKD